MNIFDKIKVTKANLGKSKETAGNKYRLKITYNNKIISMNYHDNINNKATTKDYIYALMLDSHAYEYANGNVSDFMAEFGYENYKIAVKVYNACNKQYNKYNLLFTKSEQKQIEKLLEDY